MGLRESIKHPRAGAGLVASGLVVALLCSVCCGGSLDAGKAQQELEREFKSIAPLQGAAPLDYHSSHKSSQALVGSTYSTKQSYAEIRSHYDKELTGHGWKFHREGTFSDRGKDLGGRTVEYCKGGYKASLQYAGERASYAWSYALDMSSGLESLADQWQGDVCK